jgi:hypothetical protein
MCDKFYTHISQIHDLFVNRAQDNFDRARYNAGNAYTAAANQLMLEFPEAFESESDRPETYHDDWM